MKHTFLFLAAVALASPHHGHQSFHVKRAPNVVAASSTKYLCDITSNNVPHVGRDVGFWGQIGDTIIHTYGKQTRLIEDRANYPGDTLALDPLPFYMTTSSSAIATDDPCVVHDAALADGDHPAEFLPLVSEYAEFVGNTSLGGSNIIGLDDSHGMLFFLKQ